MKNYIMLDNKPIAEIYLADTFSSRLLGYMFQKKPSCQSIMFQPCNSIHTFFMKFNIDVLFLNEDMEVVKKIENLKKGKIILPVKEARIVMEAAAGVLTDVKEGSKINLI